MNLPLIVDLVLAGIVLICVLVGSGRGLLRSLIHAVKAILAVIGASYVSKMFEARVTDFIYPVFKKKVIKRVIQLAPKTLDSLDLPELNLDFSGMGVNLDTVNDYLQQVRSNSGNNLMAGSSDLFGQLAERVEAAAEVLGATMVRALLFLVAFVLILVLLSIIVSIIDGIFELPVIKKFNHVGGALIGLLESLFILYLFVYVAKTVSMGWIENFAESTVFLNFLVNHDPLAATSFLKDNAHTIVKEIEP